MNKKYLTDLYMRYLSNHCEKEDIHELLTYFGEIDEEKLFELVLNEFELVDEKEEDAINNEEKIKLSKIYNVVKKGINKKNKKDNNRRLYIIRFSVAALFVLLIGGAMLWHLFYQPIQTLPKQLISKSQVNDISPGHFGATLHLSNGQTIMLDSTQNGALAKQGSGVQIIKNNGQIKYAGASNKLIYNTITTGSGRECKLILSDGTKVWLNSESSLTYPISFTGKTRTVQVSGEAYFEVVHNAKQPFQVKVKNQLIEDIGTSFNVESYANEIVTKTTLVEGSIKVSKDKQSIILKPGQQAETGDQIGLNKNVNIAEEIAWKNGYFIFQQTSLKQIMQQISRWYNVSIEYRGNIQPSLFTGKIPRTMQASKVLEVLEQAGVHFKIEKIPEQGNQGNIIVIP
ncbi:MAG TPA: FecR family protein [Arachidicoccus soli]|nr:FecR family protein [Arachidicoccus soli]